MLSRAKKRNEVINAIMLLDQFLQVLVNYVDFDTCTLTFCNTESLHNAPGILVGCGSKRMSIHTDKIIAIQSDCKGLWKPGRTVIYGT